MVSQTVASGPHLAYRSGEPAQASFLQPGLSLDLRQHRFDAIQSQVEHESSETRFVVLLGGLGIARRGLPLPRTTVDAPWAFAWPCWVPCTPERLKVWCPRTRFRNDLL